MIRSSGRDLVPRYDTRAHRGIDPRGSATVLVGWRMLCTRADGRPTKTICRFLRSGPTRLPYVKKQFADSAERVQTPYEYPFSETAAAPRDLSALTAVLLVRIKKDFLYGWIEWARGIGESVRMEETGRPTARLIK